MELSNKLSNLRKDIDSVENEIKDNVISNQNELFKYSESYSNINNYNISGTSQQLYDKISQLKSKISADYDELSNDIVDLTNVESALNLLRQVFKFRTLSSLLDRRLQNSVINDQDIAQIVLTVEELDKMLLNPDLNKLQAHKSKIQAQNSNNSKSSSIDHLLLSNKGFLNNVFDNLAM
ncbi:hypothetical protein E3P92_03715 [Wallemia ichthyophaga]|uniref:Conserved oligomeric Golgi complex subunit 5 N-terminal domain-containing protein n=1 Tax=Wallemia ichthyophaga TaxID=245174 RepID=A0A4T0H2P2_WALIC|nr:hypothetical protein E3P91_01811 [Wallemia ichthyophaga]TIA77980.1 hypothetical protein E3P98_04027 [Wallemia ichthyophaga]TIA87899.1 hypothetical protein E3P97_03771 [Wallemia ichthyophaga]TIA95498.1 hypothetical protein E3P95_03691 [Wallemia ichthyophaga]TIA96450.1 hypothetical protein E3P94_03700 [Wallemia ichthyophaga]